MGLSGAVPATDSTFTVTGPAMNGSGQADRVYSVDEIAFQIRNHSVWDILGVSTIQQGKGFLYRFKLINPSGRVMILNVNPRRPNLTKIR